MLSPQRVFPEVWRDSSQDIFLSSFSLSVVSTPGGSYVTCFTPLFYFLGFTGDTAPSGLLFWSLQSPVSVVQKGNPDHLTLFFITTTSPTIDGIQSLNQFSTKLFLNQFQIMETVGPFAQDTENDLPYNHFKW